MIGVTIESALEEFNRLLQEALTQASKQALKATANDVVKITLPNTLKNTSKDKPASKQKSTFSKNLKALKGRIKENIVGDGMEGSGIPTAIPNADGEPIPNSIRGIPYMPYFLVAKPKGAKRRYKVAKTRAKVVTTSQELLAHIKKNTELKSEKITFRQRKQGSSIVWITKPSIAKQAAAMLQKRAGNLLSGWSALANKAAESEGNILNGVLGSQEVDRKGSANIKVGDGETTFKASNDEVGTNQQHYQQSVIDRSIPSSFQYHLQNAINRINMNTLRTKAKAKFN